MIAFVVEVDILHKVFLKLAYIVFSVAATLHHVIVFWPLIVNGRVKENHGNHE